jgi:predicted amino acid-binding ACT domain protein
VSDKHLVEKQPYVISILARDRVGIIAGVAGAIAGLGGDIADLRQSVLRGYFTMILLATFPAGVSAKQIRRQIAEAGDSELEAAVRPANDAAEVESSASQDHTYLLTARGPDRIGFVAGVSAFCARNRLNILDLSTAVAGGQYVMMLLVDVRDCDDLDALRERLKRFEQEAGLTAVLQHEAIFRATNEVDL